MVINTTMMLAMAAICLGAVATAPEAGAQTQRRTVTVKHAPVANPGDTSETWDARQNIIDSKRYDELLRTNPAFRQSRMRKECGGITDAELRQSCLASFDRYKS